MRIVVMRWLVEWGAHQTAAWRTIWAAVVVTAILLCASGARAGTPLVGAIRWDAWQESGSVNAAVETTLGPAHWHGRLPFFSSISGADAVRIDGNHQAIMDQEIAYAADAGLAYWAFDIYPDGNGMSNGLHLYLNSAHKSRINFSLLLQGGWISNPGSWNAEVQRYVTYFRDAQYQKVLGNRPLVYLFNVQSMLGPGKYTDWSAVHTAFDQLRAAAAAAGVGNPYIVIQGWHGPTDKTYMLNVGADAIGAYAVAGGAPTGSPYASLAAQAHNFWESDKATGASVVPIVTAGWDNRPRAENPTPWDAGSWNYFLAPTPTELTNHLTDALAWTSANRCAATPANTVLLYAWNEHDEGGWISPTLNPNTGAADSTRLDAIRSAITQFTARRTLLNASFETPPVTSGWYVVPAGGMPAAFAWSNNFGAGSYVLASSSALHFSKAGAGSQALLLGRSQSVWQDLGPTAADTRYTVTFYLLHDNYRGSPGGKIRAEILDCANVIGASDFSVPSKPNSWQPYTLTGISSHLPAGNLFIKFTGISGSPWLDNVSLSPP